jgi:hypothetical protein
MSPRILVAAAPVLALLLSAGAEAAQDHSDDWLERCQKNRGWNNGRSEVHCELRESRAAATPRLSVDGGTNGGVTVRAWNERDVRVRAQVQAWAGTREEARELARQVRVTTSGGDVRATGPERSGGAQLVRELRGVRSPPHRPRVETTNGGISVERVAGEMHLQARNGPVSLRGVSGDVHARTANGPMRVVLEGEPLGRRTAGRGDAQRPRHPERTAAATPRRWRREP